MRRVVPAIALSAFALVSAHPVGASEPRPAVPEGFVQLVDDTGVLAVVVPATWTDVDTAPATNTDGTARPYIAASTNIQSFLGTFDVPGLVYVALPFTADPQSVIDRGGVLSGCGSIGVQPYTTALYAGLVQVGTQCGPSGSATWNMVVANPPTSELTLVVQVQTASAADQAGMDMVLSTFDVFAPGTLTSIAPPSISTTVPAVPAVPATPTIPTVAPVPVAAAGVTTVPVPTVPVAVGQLEAAAATGYRTFIAGFAAVVYEDEDSLKVGECPVIDVPVFNELMSATGLIGPFDAESGGEMETMTDPTDGETIVPIGVFCDFDVSDDTVAQVSSASVDVLDIGTNPALMDTLGPVFEAASAPTPGPAGIGGSVYTSCGPPSFDDDECATVWVGGQLLVAFTVEYAGAADPGATQLAFQSVLPATLERLGSFTT